MAVRLLKWVGDPPVLKADGWSVANWKYENARTISMPFLTERIITKHDVIGRDTFGREVHKANGLSRDYHWHSRLPNFVLEVDEDDARIILTRQPHEFRDVTNVADPSQVRNDPIILKAGDAEPVVVPGDQKSQRPHRIVLPKRTTFLDEYKRNRG